MTPDEKQLLRRVAAYARETWGDVVPRSPQNADYAVMAKPSNVVSLLDELDLFQREMDSVVEQSTAYEESLERALRGALLDMGDLPTKKPSSSNTARGLTTQATTTTERRRQRPGEPPEVLERTSTTEPVVVETFAGPIANVKLALGRTVNLGNYQFARIDVSVTMPCPAGAEERTYDRALDFVDKRLHAEIVRARRSAS